VDPKKVELSIYRTIENHFLAKLPGEEEAIITDTRKVIHTLNALCIEMDNRYDLLKKQEQEISGSIMKSLPGETESTEGASISSLYCISYR